MPLSTGAKVGIGIGIGATVLGVGGTVAYFALGWGEQAQDKPPKDLDPGAHAVELNRNYVLRPGPPPWSQPAILLEWFAPDGEQIDPFPSGVATYSMGEKGVHVSVRQPGTFRLSFHRNPIDAAARIATVWDLEA